jgi:hypothetical protein
MLCSHSLSQTDIYNTPDEIFFQLTADLFFGAVLENFTLKSTKIFIKKPSFVACVPIGKFSTDFFVVVSNVN